MPSFEDITYVVEDATAIVTINRPERYNAFTARTVEEMISAFRLAWADRAVQSVILTGAGLLGGDLRPSGPIVAEKIELDWHNARHVSRLDRMLAEGF